jgi:hypothetical protein
MKIAHVFKIAFFSTVILSLSCAKKSDLRVPAVVYSQKAHKLEKLAAKEVRRYIYLRTGRLPLLVTSDEMPQGKSIFVGVKSRDVFRSAGADESALKKIADLGPEEHGLKSIPNGLCIAGGDPVGTLYGAYRFCEKLGVGFDIDGDVLPDRRLESVRLDGFDEWNKPLFRLRGVNPFHDFPEGPDWWEKDNYLSVMEQLAKMRMNFIGLHNYNYRSDYNRMEPGVWVGLKKWTNPDGSVLKSYPSKYANTGLFSWGYKPKRTSDFSGGAADLFDKDDYGPGVMDGLTPMPDTPEKMNGLFDRVGSMFGETFSFGRDLGIRTCVGTEAAFEIHDVMMKNLAGARVDPGDSAGLAALYEGIFTRIEKSYPIDYYWIWTDEGWTWAVPDPKAVERSVRSIRTAHDVMKKLGAPFRLAISGWVLGPPDDRTLFDKRLTKDVIVSSINRNLGYDPVDYNFIRVTGREKWAIPWLEDDPALMNAQLWAGRVRRDAADALAYGCSALIGLHWRTAAIAPAFASLARSAWEQPWNPDVGRPYSPPERIIPEIRGTDEDSLYGTAATNPGYYDFPDPGPTGAKITLKFCETEAAAPGERVFDVLVNDSAAVKNVDVFKAAGRNRAYDLVIRQKPGGTPRTLKIDFDAKKGYPMISGIVVETGAYTRRINCGGEAFRGYEKDIINPFNPRHPSYGHRPEEYKPGHKAFSGDVPVTDFYRDWCRARFGEEVENRAAALFSSIDGNLPRASEWRNGPGDVRVDRTPWSRVSKQWRFVDAFGKLESRVKGPGNRARFAYWRDLFEYARILAHFGCATGEMDSIAEKIQGSKNPAESLELAERIALPKRLEMTRIWDDLVARLLAFTSTTGELGMIANLEQDNWPVELLFKHDSLLTFVLKRGLPPGAYPEMKYKGGLRIVVPSARTSLGVDEDLALKIIILGDPDPAKSALYWKPLGSDRKFEAIPLTHVARGVYRVVLPKRRIGGADLEWYAAAADKNGTVVWPASAPEINQTVLIRWAQTHYQAGHETPVN